MISIEHHLTLFCQILTRTFGIFFFLSATFPANVLKNELDICDYGSTENYDEFRHFYDEENKEGAEND